MGEHLDGSCGISAVPVGKWGCICGACAAAWGELFCFFSFILCSFSCSVAECCSTPYSLVGLTFTVSYLALGLLKLCKFYLGGYGAFQNGNVMHR